MAFVVSVMATHLILYPVASEITRMRSAGLLAEFSDGGRVLLGTFSKYWRKKANFHGVYES